MQNINVDFTKPDEVTGYIKGLKACAFMIGIGAKIALTKNEPFNPLAPIHRAIEELEEKYVSHVR